jgi:hypothetical protein
MKKHLLKPGMIIKDRYSDPCLFFVLSADKKEDDYYNTICLTNHPDRSPRQGELFRVHFCPPSSTWIIVESKRP